MLESQVVLNDCLGCFSYYAYYVALTKDKPMHQKTNLFLLNGDFLFTGKIYNSSLSIQISPIHIRTVDMIYHVVLLAMLSLAVDN